MPLLREFSTVGLPRRRRVELWEGHNAEALIGLRCRTLDAQPLEANELNLQLDHIHLARVKSTSHVVERDSGLIEKSPTDAIAMYFILRGESFFYSGDGVRTVCPGQLLVCDADRAFTRGFAPGLEELVVKIPRALFADATGKNELSEPAVYDFSKKGDVHATALARLIGRATHPADPAAPDERTIIELISVLGTGARDGYAKVHRAAAKAFIERRLPDPSLTAAEVAAAISISPRHLSRVFAEAGTSVPAYLRARRLELARELLSDPVAVNMSVSAVAHACGFTSPAHFSNAFVKHFGERASDVRRRAAGR